MIVRIFIALAFVIPIVAGRWIWPRILKDPQLQEPHNAWFISVLIPLAIFFTAALIRVGIIWIITGGK